MNDITTIKVSKRTLERLRRIVGELIKREGKKFTLEDAIIHLLEKNESKDELTTLNNNINQDREEFLTLFKQKFFGAGPEDFKEYDFEDIGG